jgi:hypothetical protein
MMKASENDDDYRAYDEGYEAGYEQALKDIEAAAPTCRSPEAVRAAIQAAILTRKTREDE